MRRSRDPEEEAEGCEKDRRDDSVEGTEVAVGYIRG